MKRLKRVRLGRSMLESMSWVNDCVITFKLLLCERFIIFVFDYFVMSEILVCENGK